MSNKLRIKCGNCGHAVFIDDFLSDSTVFCSKKCMFDYELKIVDAKEVE